MKSALTILLALSLMGNIILFLHWQKERADHAETIRKESEFLDGLSKRMSRMEEGP